MFDPRKHKDQTKTQKEQIKEEKSLIKLRSIKPHSGHSLFKVIDNSIIPVEPEDYIENRIYLKYINKDGTFGYSVSVKMKEGNYVSALNKKTAKKQISN